MGVKTYVREEYEADWREHSMQYASAPEGESRTVQEQAEEADINTIVRRFGLSGTMPVVPQLPSYEDFDGVLDYQTAMNSIIAADRAFMQYPADFRARFENSPQKFLEFCSIESNRDEMVKLGLIKPKEPVVVTAPPKEGA